MKKRPPTITVGGLFLALVDHNVEQSILDASTSVSHLTRPLRRRPIHLHVRHHMGIQIQGDANLGVSQGLRHNLRVDVLLQRRGGEGVAQPMEHRLPADAYNLAGPPVPVARRLPAGFQRRLYRRATVAPGRSPSITSPCSKVTSATVARTTWRCRIIRWRGEKEAYFGLHANGQMILAPSGTTLPSVVL